MNIELLGHKAKVAFMSPHRELSFILPGRGSPYIAVHIELVERVGSCLGFAVNIEPRDYKPEDFETIVRAKGEKQLQEIIDLDKKADEQRRRDDLDRKELNKLTANLGDKLGVEYHLDPRS